MAANICFSKDLYGKLLNKRAKVRGQSKLHMLGKNGDGICVYSKPLRRSRLVEGCKYMPGIDAETLSKGYYEIARKGLEFAGFAHLSIADQLKQGWFYIFGYTLSALAPNVPIVTFGPNHIRGRAHGRNKVFGVRVKVVKSIIKPLTLKKEQKNGRTRSKHSNRTIR